MSDELRQIAKRLIEAPKGVFAADASTASIEKRLTDAGITPSEEVRKRYRELLLTTSGLHEYVGGVILFDETIRQNTTQGKKLAEVVKEQGILPGIKVDRGAHDMPGWPGEKLTEGLDGLAERLAEYYEMGARFTKWRAVITIGEGTPTREAITANAYQLARYAAASQAAGMVPIVEPEVLMDGAHTIDQCQAATELTGRIVFSVMQEQRIEFESMLYKTNMVVAGKKCADQPDDAEIAHRTVETLKKIVPIETAGVVFLSGGMDATAATLRLNEIAKLSAPWRMTFSFERALEGPVMAAWKGAEENVKAAQETLLSRARMNSLASVGKYQGEGQ